MRGPAFSSTSLQARGHAGLAEIFLREDVGGDLAPVLRHHDAFELEDDGAVGVLDLGRGAPERDALVGRLARLSEAPCDLHSAPVGMRLFLWSG